MADSSAIPWWVPWGNVVAWLALVITVLPHANNWRKGRKLSMTIGDRGLLAHLHGRTALALWVQLHHTGGRPLVVRRLSCELTWSSGRQGLAGRLRWLTDRLGSENEVSVPFGTVRLQPGEEFAGFIQFTDPAQGGPDQQKKDKDLTKRMRADLRVRLDREREDALQEGREPRLVELNAALVAEANAYVERQLVIGTGDYTLTVRAYGWKGDAPVAEAKCQMILFDADTEDLLADRDEYKYGASWTHPATAPKWIGVDIRASV